MSDSLLTELLTATQVAELLQMKRTTVEDYARRGLLPSLKLGRQSPVRSLRRRGRAGSSPKRRVNASRSDCAGKRVA